MNEYQTSLLRHSQKSEDNLMSVERTRKEKKHLHDLEISKFGTQLLSVSDEINRLLQQSDGQIHDEYSTRFTQLETVNIA